MSIKALFCTSLLLCTASFALDKRWKYVTSSDIPGKEKNTYIDIETISRSGNTVNYWTFEEYKEPQLIPTNTEDVRYYITMKAYITGQCKERIITINQITSFQDDYKFIQEFPQYTIALPPGSAGELVLKKACSKKKR